ncbi:MAG: chemotaxis protein methyltransferase CheR [Sulfurimonas sp.]|jgi:chemotaxis protein methyltransferase CheR|uniref:CheR family methyltransferase n=1 Tax=Sulfurimonas sp. TaxID=2022749 RepID=UPI0039E5C812
MFNFFKKKKPIEDFVDTDEYIEDYSNVEIIANYFHNETGITFDTQISILNSKVSGFCKKRAIASYTQLLSDVQSLPSLRQELIDHLTTNETYFYRELKQIHQLVKLVKESPSSHIDILCAPSATGEEPYSIAIALLEAGVSPSKFHILGIDINADAIQKAKTALYTQRNVRNLSDAIISKYFIKDASTYRLKDTIKSLISFKITNIFDSSFKDIGSFDFVFSRNMLIYFDKETKLKAKAILEKLRKDNDHDVFFGHADLF